MARPRTPTVVLELKGSIKRNPGRHKDRDDEPIPTTKIGKAPATYDQSKREVWAEMARQGFWLTGADTFLLEVAVTLMDRFRRDTLSEKQTPHLIGALNKLGFGPAERSKIKAPGAKDELKSGFAKFR